MADGNNDEPRRRYPEGPPTPEEMQDFRELLDDWGHAKWLRKRSKVWLMYLIAVFGGLYAIRDWLGKFGSAILAAFK